MQFKLMYFMDSIFRVNYTQSYFQGHLLVKFHTLIMRCLSDLPVKWQSYFLEKSDGASREQTMLNTKM